MVAKKRVSKKLKSSWRKHVDIQDVEDFLEDQRLEERLGPPLSEVPNDELFVVDTKRDVALLSTKERKKLKASKPLRCFSALQPHTKVPDPIQKRNRVRTPEERKNDLVKRKEILNKSKGILKAKEIQAKKNRQEAERSRNNRLKRGEYLVDLWDEKQNVVAEIEKDQWATLNTKKHNLRGTGISVKNVRKAVQVKHSPLPAVEAPHPGMSYNPTYQDHQNLLRIVAEKEQKLIKTEEHLTRVTRGMFQKVTEEERDKSWIVEMSEGLPSKEGMNIEENNADDTEDYSSINPPVENRKKSAKQRRKQKEQLELEKARMALKLEKKKRTDLHRIKALNNQIETIENKQKIYQEQRKKKLELKKKETKVLGSLKYEDPDLEFSLGEEIAGNLRNLKSEGNVLIDRFKSMQKRNILAPTKRQVRKKAKVKKYVKPGHKDTDWKKTVAK